MSNMPPPTMPPPVMAPPQLERMSSPDAPRGTRLAAALIDSACGIVVYLFTIFLFNEPMLMILGLAALAAYQVYLLSTNGQTIGKQVMNIRIVKIDTEENGGFVTNVLVRGILNGIIGFIPFYGLADILFIYREDQRCIHDHIAGTKVVME
ncbi:MAG: RDD family protein [candidate division Zixibacteria bacterium]|nr:RDD family protein [candidate division Zixibacteria bacterium]